MYNKRNNNYLSNNLEYVFESSIGQRVKYTANTVTTAVSTANTNTDGTGTTNDVFNAANGDGALIKSITIKGIGSISRGMIRLYMYDNTNKNLSNEIEIPERSQASTQEGFAISFEPDFFLQYDWSIYASTEVAEDFVVTVEALDIDYP